LPSEKSDLRFISTKANNPLAKAGDFEKMTPTNERRAIRHGLLAIQIRAGYLELE